MTLCGGRPGWYDPTILDALADLRQSTPQAAVRDLPVARLRAGMILAQDVRTSKGMLFIVRGQEVTASLLVKLRNLSQGFLGEEAIRVIVGDARQNTPEGPARR